MFFDLPGLQEETSRKGPIESFGSGGEDGHFEAWTDVFLSRSLSGVPMVGLAETIR